MNVIVPTPNTEGQCWPVRLLKGLLLISVLGLSACSTTYVAPKLPEPAADLMVPEPTGSEYLSNVSESMSKWEKRLRDSLIK